MEGVTVIDITNDLIQDLERENITLIENSFCDGVSMI